VPSCHSMCMENTNGSDPTRYLTAGSDKTNGNPGQTDDETGHAYPGVDHLCPWGLPSSTQPKQIARSSTGPAMEKSSLCVLYKQTWVAKWNMSTAESKQKNKDRKDGRKNKDKTKNILQRKSPCNKTFRFLYSKFYTMIRQNGTKSTLNTANSVRGDRQ
jgi:hypothetical protein